MKPLPAPEVAGNSPWERFDTAVRTVFSVSKDAFVKKDASDKKRRARKRTAKKKK